MPANQLQVCLQKAFKIACSDAKQVLSYTFQINIIGEQNVSQIA